MNYGEFKTLLTRYLKREDLTDLYASWFEFTCSRIDMQLRLQEQEYRAITKPTSQYVSLPPDFIEMRSLQSSLNGGTPLEYVTAKQIDLRNLASVPPGKTCYYTIFNNQVELIAPPSEDSELTLEMIYYAKLVPLTQDSASNKVLEAYPNLYLYGCMLEAANFLKDEQDLKNYAQLWRDYSTELNNKQSAGRHSASNLRMRAV
jgi:hypothetical protein